jgi:hypothetical protein
LEQPVSHKHLEVGNSEFKQHVLDSLLGMNKLLLNGIFQHNFSDLPVQQIYFISRLYVPVTECSTIIRPFSILQKMAQTRNFVKNAVSAWLYYKIGIP